MPNSSVTTSSSAGVNSSVDMNSVIYTSCGSPCHEAGKIDDETVLIIGKLDTVGFFRLYAALFLRDLELHLEVRADADG